VNVVTLNDFKQLLYTQGVQNYKILNHLENREIILFIHRKMYKKLYKPLIKRKKDHFALGVLLTIRQVSHEDLRRYKKVDSYEDIKSDYIKRKGSH